MRLVTLEGDSPNLSGVPGYLCGRAYCLSGDDQNFYILPESIEVHDGSLGFFKFPSFKLPALKLPALKVPKIALPKAPAIKLPTIKAPKITAPKLPAFKMPAFKMPQIKMPAIKMPQVKIPVPDLGQAVQNLVTNPLQQLMNAPMDLAEGFASNALDAGGEILSHVADTGMQVLDHALPALDATMQALPGALDAAAMAFPGMGITPDAGAMPMMDPAAAQQPSSDFKWPWEKDEPDMLPLLLIGGGVLALVMFTGSKKGRR